MQKTNRKQQVYDFIKCYISKHKYPPSFREISDGVGLKSLNSVKTYIEKLKQDGLIETDHPDGSPRAIRVPGLMEVRNEGKIL